MCGLIIYNIAFCRGVAALHALSDSVIHRDIKSFNFLVDHQLNAKLADLELGADTDMQFEIKNIDDNALFDYDFLANWIAPEVLQQAPYTQASDIYAMSLVFWEIFSVDSRAPDGEINPQTPTESTFWFPRSTEPRFWFRRSIESTFWFRRFTESPFWFRRCFWRLSHRFASGGRYCVNINIMGYFLNSFGENWQNIHRFLVLRYVLAYFSPIFCPTIRSDPFLKNYKNP